MSILRRVCCLSAVLLVMQLPSPALARQSVPAPVEEAAKPAATSRAATTSAAESPPTPAGDNPRPATPLPAPAPAAPPADDSSAMGELLGIVLPLALIIVGLLTVLYLVRRRFGLTGKDAPLTILQILPVGPRERLVLVRSRAGRVFAIGVASQSVTMVTHLDPADLLEPLAEPSARDIVGAGPGQ